MADRVYIKAAAAVGPHGDLNRDERRLLTQDAAKPDLTPLVKSICGQALRQASHLVELGVLGAELARQRMKAPISPRAGIYIGTGLGELTRNSRLFEQVMPPANGLASPFDFINSGSNTTAFYVAKRWDLNARNLTMADDAFSFESALHIATHDVLRGVSPQALVGGVDEIGLPRELHLIRLPVDPERILGEGCGWLFLDTEVNNAIGELLFLPGIFEKGEDISAWAKEVAEWASPGLINDQVLRILPGYNITGDDAGALVNAIPGSEIFPYLQYCGLFYTASAFALAHALELDHDVDTQYLHIMSDSHGRTMTLLMRVFATASD